MLLRQKRVQDVAYAFRNERRVLPRPAEVGDAEPRVQRVLPGSGPLKGEVRLVAHRELKTSRRVRMVFDLLTSEL